MLRKGGNARVHEVQVILDNNGLHAESARVIANSDTYGALVPLDISDDARRALKKNGIRLVDDGSEIRLVCKKN